MDSVCTIPLDKSNHSTCLQSQSQPVESAETIISSNLPLIWIACLIRLSTSENLPPYSPLQCPDIFSFFEIIVFNPPLWQQWVSETPDCKDTAYFFFCFFASPSLFCLSSPNSLLPTPTQRSVNSYQGAVAYTAEGQRCCT